MDSQIRHIDSIAEYNKYLGVETLHPLVSVIDLSKANTLKHARQTFGFYCVFLKGGVNCELYYGRKRYDYQEGTVVCIAPGQVIGIGNTGEEFQPHGWALCFDPELIRGTSLGRSIKEYTFFSYEVNEALHLSEKEKDVFMDCLQNIGHELNHDIDRLSKRLIANNIELLLNYCLRFYERQFITRQNVNRSIITRFDSLLDEYFTSGKARQNGLPSVKHCAGELCLSPNYFGDLVKKETGKSAQEYIQLTVVNIAKERILAPDSSISQIAYDLGFKYPQHFTRMFKKIAGVTPNDYRSETLPA